MTWRRYVGVADVYETGMQYDRWGGTEIWRRSRGATGVQRGLVALVQLAVIWGLPVSACRGTGLLARCVKACMALLMIYSCTARFLCVQVWACEALREQFLALPYPAVRCLLGSEATAVATENTALVALTGWVEEGAHGRATTAAQRKELLSLVRIKLTVGYAGLASFLLSLLFVEVGMRVLVLHGCARMQVWCERLYCCAARLEHQVGQLGHQLLASSLVSAAVRLMHMHVYDMCCCAGASPISDVLVCG